MDVKFLQGLQSGYDELTSIESNTFYYTTDTKNLYLGTTLIGEAVAADKINELIEQGAPSIFASAPVPVVGTDCSGMVWKFNPKFGPLWNSLSTGVGFSGGEQLIKWENGTSLSVAYGPWDVFLELPSGDKLYLYVYDFSIGEYIMQQDSYTFEPNAIISGTVVGLNDNLTQSWLDNVIQVLTLRSEVLTTDWLAQNNQTLLTTTEKENLNQQVPQLPSSFNVNIGANLGNHIWRLNPACDWEEVLDQIDWEYNHTQEPLLTFSNNLTLEVQNGPYNLYIQDATNNTTIRLIDYPNDGNRYEVTTTNYVFAENTSIIGIHSSFSTTALQSLINAISLPGGDYVATQEWVEDQNYLTEHQDLTGYATQSWVESKLNSATEQLPLTVTFEITTAGTTIDLSNLTNEAIKIDWGDDSTSSDSKSHTYASTGTYICKIYGVTQINASAFDSSDITEYPIITVVIPDSVTSIGEKAFYLCHNLTSVVIGDSVTSIGDYAFGYCSSLISVEIPDSVTAIGGSAFQYCSSLTCVEIGNSVTSIGSYTFEACNSLTSVVIGDSVATIDEYAFDASPVASIIFTRATPLAGLASTTLPSTVKEILVPAASVTKYQTVLTNYADKIAAIITQKQWVQNQNYLALDGYGTSGQVLTSTGSGVEWSDASNTGTIFGPVSNGHLVEWSDEHQALIDSDIDITNYINPAVPGVKIGAWTDEMLAGMVDLSSQKLLFDTSITTSARLSTTVFSTTGGYQLTGIISQQSEQQYMIVSALTNPDGSTTTIGGAIIIGITGAILQRVWNTSVVVQRTDGLYEFTLPADFGTIIPESVTVTATDLQSFSYITHNMSELIGDALLLNNTLISAPAEDGTLATQEWVENQNYLTEHQDLTDYATQEWVEDKGYLALDSYGTTGQVLTSTGSGVEWNDVGVDILPATQTTDGLMSAEDKVKLDTAPTFSYDATTGTLTIVDPTI